MLETLFIILLIIHAVAHLPGFLVSFNLVKLKDLPYSTKVFFKKIELGESGIKLYGLIWLVLSIIFIFAAILIIIEKPVFKETVIAGAILSLILSIVGLPETKFGIIINILIIVYLLI